MPQAPSSIRFAVLLTVHNRRETTLRCLERLFAQELSAGTTFTAFLVDDGCTDGTPEAIRERFPQVTLIPGDGSLFWNQGMRLAWKTAAADADWDAYLWLNDDTMLLPGALTTMLETLDIQERETGKRGIVVGSCREPRSVERGARSEEEIPQKTPAACPQLPAPSSLPPAPCPLPSVPTYGGRKATGLLQPTDQPQAVDVFNGNLVAVSREAFAALGNLSPAYRHSFGDIDYGIRARQKGIPVWIAPGFLAECGTNPLPAWKNPAVPLTRRHKAFFGPKGMRLSELRHIKKLSGSKSWFFNFLKLYKQVLFPK
jgi:GT2 family glycosyltransferase